jgi:hypothetical protein
MTSMQSSDSILKTDSLARVRTAPERRQELLEEFDRSGLSGSKFAALVGVKYSTFAQWAAKRKRAVSANAGAVDNAGKVRWLEAVIGHAQGASQEVCGLRVHFAGGARADITNPRQAELAAALLRAMNMPSAPC